MNEIIFRKTANIFINTGIVSLEYYLKQCKKRNIPEFPIFKHHLTNNELIIKCENQTSLYTLLERIYYYMGKDVYDTATNKQLENKENVYYNTIIDEFERFPKMNTYGLTQLFTNNAQGNTTKANNTVKAEELKKTDSILFNKFTKYFEENNLKMLSKLYFNEPYTKITRLIKPEIKYFEAGTNQCTLTGTSRKVLVDIKNTSAFISGLNSFESHLKNSNRKICWEVMYLSFFAPKLALYNYTGNYSTLNIFFFDSDNLLNIKNLFEQNFSFYKDPIELRNGNYRSNFKIYKFGKEKPEVFTEKYELSFMLIYTFYKQFLEKLQIKIGTKPMDWNPFDAFQMKHVPINLKTFKADEFSGTIRPNSFETINNFKYLVRLCFYLEKNQVNFYLLLFSLKLIKPSEKNGQNKYRIERLIRNQVLGNIINSKSILNEIEYIFLQCYKILTNSQPDYVLLGIKNYKQLLLLLTLYEPIIKYGGQKDMDNDTQDMAIKLGQTIGFGILEYDTSTTKIQNAKQGKSYIIALKKARTQEQLLDELIRLQSRFNLKYIKNLEWLTSKNFNYVKQFAIISALNILNSVLTPSKFNKNEEK